MKNQYIINQGTIEGVEGEKTVKQISFYKFDCEILITQEKEYYNVYIIHDSFKQEPLNNLHLQEPLEFGIPSDLQCEVIAIGFYLWNKHNKDFSITFNDID